MSKAAEAPAGATIRTNMEKNRRQFNKKKLYI